MPPSDSPAPSEGHLGALVVRRHSDVGDDLSHGHGVVVGPDGQDGARA